MASHSVIERFNVIEDIGAGQIAGFVDPFSDALLFQRTEERFSDRIIPTVATSAHTGGQVIGPAETLPVVTAILATLIRVHDDLAFWFTPPYGHHQCIQRELAGEGRFHRPTHHVTSEKIDTHSQIQPALPGADISDIGHPNLIGPHNRKLSLYTIRRYDGKSTGYPAWRFIAAYGFDPV